MKPYPWLGGPSTVEFFYSECGHVIGTTGTSADLLAEQVWRASAGFERDLAIVLSSGEYIWRSSASYGIGAKHAVLQICAEFPNVTPESIENAKATHQNWLDWLAAD